MVHYYTDLLDRLAVSTKDGDDHTKYPRWQALVNFIENLPSFLLCAYCTIHATTYMNFKPPPFDKAGKERALWKWGVDFHNAVNTRTGKRELSYEEADQVMQDDWANPPSEDEIVRRTRDHRYINRLELFVNEEDKKKAAVMDHEEFVAYANKHPMLPEKKNDRRRRLTFGITICLAVILGLLIVFVMFNMMG